MEISDRQQVGLAFGQPRARGSALAFGTMPVAAANGDFPLAALWANLVMGSQRWFLAEFRLFFSMMTLLCVFNLSP
jgi:hypothetical protein